MATLAGTKLDKYEMLEEVGHGGMAVVYRGHDCVLKREVAVKVLHAHLSDRQESRLRLEREALAVAKLRHENILEIFDYSGPKAAESYIVTEFIHGPTLRQWIEQGHEPRPAIAAMIIHRLCLALCAAHKNGIVHRDIKPENVMIRADDGCIKLMDFGIAQILDNQKLTMTGQLIGSPAYMAPELISGRPLDARTDLFSLGILLYQLATGDLPFSGRNPHEVLNRIADGDYPAASTICPLVDRDLEAIIDRALANNPDDRFQSVESFATELEAYLLEMGIEPAHSELASYFKSPVTYIAELDRRVSATLLERAERLAGDGQGARAIRLLGRVLELDSEHKRALTLLSKLRKRERRIRHLVVGGGMVALGGMVAAGLVLIPRQPAVETADEPRLAAHKLGTPTKPKRNTISVPLLESDGDGAETEGEIEAGAPTAGEMEADTSASPPQARPAPAVRRVTKSPRATRCVINFTGIPASSAANLEATINGKSFGLDELATGVEVDFDGDSGLVKLAESGWSGWDRISPSECAAGPVIVEAVAYARLTFVEAPPELVVTCVSGCPEKIANQPFVPKDFPQIRLDDGPSEIKLQFKAANFHKKLEKVAIYPGPQDVKVKMRPL